MECEAKERGKNNFVKITPKNILKNLHIVSVVFCYNYMIRHIFVLFLFFLLSLHYCQ